MQKTFQQNVQIYKRISMKSCEILKSDKNPEILIEISVEILKSLLKS